MTIDQSTGRRPIPARRLAIVARIARALAEAGATPNQISLFGLLVGAGSGAAFAMTAVAPDWARPFWFAAAVMVGLRGLANMFDGMVAVEHGKASPVGMFYNEVPDRLSDVALMVGAGYSLGGDPTAGWAAACAALFVAYTRAIGVCAGAPADFRGPFAKQQRMFLLALVGLWLSLTPAAWRIGEGGMGLTGLTLWIIAIGSVLTAALRLKRAMRAVERSARTTT